MLHTARLSSSDWVAAMGQESSKGASVDADLQETSTADDEVGNGASSGRQNQTLHSKVGPSTNVARKDPQRSLKRTWDESRDDEYDHAHNYVLQSPRKNANSGRTRRSISPPNVRNSLRSDRSDHWSPAMAHRRNHSNSSLDAEHPRGRADKWRPADLWRPPPGRSSSPRSPSPVGRSPSVARRTPGFSAQRRSESGSPIQERGESQSFEKHTSQSSLTWTPPGLHQKQSHFIPRASAHVVEPSMLPVEDADDYFDTAVGHQKVNFNGLKNVPTGPKLKPSSSRMLANIPPPVVERMEKKKQQPHIFISGYFLPPKFATVKHLHRFLIKNVRSESDILADGTGYYLVFPDTDIGRERLWNCYREKNEQKLFNQYELKMTCYPNGQDCHSDGAGLVNSGIKELTSGGLHGIVDASQAQLPAGQSEPSLPTPVLGKDVNSIDPRLQTKKELRTTSSDTEPSITPAMAAFRHSSPLRIPSRQDKDDASSVVSYLTGSDLSASKLPRCHVCKNTAISDLETLIQCSSCPRRYHRMCHAAPRIPDRLEPEHSWQCRRCIKKQVQPKSRLSTTSPARQVSPAPSVGQEEQPPAKRQRLEDTEPQSKNVHETTDDAPRYDNGIASLICDDPDATVAADTILQKQDSLKLNGLTAITNQPDEDELHIEEVDDLVEQSFAASERPRVTTELPKKPFVLNLKRKSIPQPDKGDRLDSHTRNQSISVPRDAKSNEKKPAHQNANITNNETFPERERHKWKGGGADKDIIHAGMKSLFLERGSNGNKFEPVQSKKRVQKEAHGGTGGRPVPESSEDFGTVKGHVGRCNETEDASKAKSSPKFRLKLHGPRPTADYPPPSKASTPQKGPVYRMRPSNTLLDKCAKCNKTIAFNPSGMSRFCSKCTKAASNDSALPSTESAHPKTTKVDEATGDLMATDGSYNGVRDIVRSHLKDGPSNLDEDEPVIDHLDFWNKPPAPSKGEGASRNGISSREPSAELDKSLESHLHPATRNNREESSSLSPAPDEAPDSAKKTKKRTSYAKTATSQYDIGDSFTRPPNSYRKLIGMALCDADDHCLKSQEIIRWINDNIPSYNVHEGSNWENGISATLSMLQEKDGQPGIWRKIVGDGAKKNQPCWYQLLPGQEDEMLHWDKLLQKAVSPTKRRHDKSISSMKDKLNNGNLQRETSSAAKGKRTSESSTQEARAKAKLSLSRARKQPPKFEQKDDHAIRRDAAQQSVKMNALDDEAAEDMAVIIDTESSDDEPLAMRRRKGVASAKPSNVSGVQSMDVVDDAMQMDDVTDVPGFRGVPALQSPTKLSIEQQTYLPPGPTEQELVAQLIKKDAEEIDFSAKSLFEEWKEYDPVHHFDTVAKLAEIECRPTRKQKYGRSRRSSDPWIEWNPERLREDTRNICLSSKPARGTRTGEHSAWEVDEQVMHFDSLEEMFELPQRPMPIVREKDVVYREGIRNESNGTLPRAKLIYRTGYGHRTNM